MITRRELANVIGSVTIIANGDLFNQLISLNKIKW